ncbi:hypothetical protein M0R45_026593 [Rubus argutus]|uniref:Uncharacterized protein n=1 Tax=Rubus argutus TaxID=59490 RepID=A0AAW1WXW3_RUBAR
MSPKNGGDGEEERHHRQRHGRVHRHKSDKHRRDACVTRKKKKISLELELEEEEASKSLYICYLEYRRNWVAYVIRSIKLGDLLSSSSSSSDDALQLRQVAYKAGDDLPGSVGCGVMGSQIVFSGGLKPCIPYGLGAIKNESAVWHTDVYALETSDPDNNIIRKMDGSLQQGKFSPLMVELGGKLYALSYRLVADPPSFEVFDPKMGTWSSLPQPPFFQPRSIYYQHAPFSYAIAGTKMFVSHENCPVFCFDVAHPNREWRLVPTMCGGGPFPFAHKSLVLDLPEGHHDKTKILFAYTHDRWCLGVYLLSLYENQESITRIGDLELPMLPHELGVAKGCDFVHIGGHKACLVVPELEVPYKQGPKYELGTHKTWGVAIAFQFHLDIAKVDKDKNNCLKLQFMPPCIFQCHTTPSTLPCPETVGCFVL